MDPRSVSALGVTAVFAIAALPIKMWLSHVEKMKGIDTPH
jgi:hypothetical protein